ncbi:TetR/AcrR family transcriptional regulator [Actinosynnema sp. NPDC047251]|uniref:Transcriptional regulator, TetR family n=1 Tax=Saccharothrix espanaensis (strain ATCC 51144 / DSM 44229 / JCM 9112 / NBRC 15066 / NRRL 15764) TaxID=1179773 RepID=K0KDT1_SACES|nr:TetR/AcrR family transcriptional regulator [Saccharothrix espanaensis]CCH35722.1 Transcriptional regulator, TetR family [Saccharothrix espanaensis DSM 44229]
MTEATRRERLRAETERDIRRQARALLVAHGRDAVTLRAIARELGITAPALYRYYDSREDLLHHLADDICTDLALELNTGLARIPEDDVTAQVYAVCRGFRRWALAHPQEFALVFASTETTLGACGPDERRQVGDQFGRVFLEVAGRLIASHSAHHDQGGDVPESLHADLTVFQQVLIDTVGARGVPADTDLLPLSAVYHITQSWVRLYGHVALEVFGRFPFAVANPEPMFDSMLAQILGEMGFTDA